MGEIILITGGSRSGKSGYSLERAQSFPGPRAFIATCPLIDDELKTRVEKHRREREGRGWKTIEEPLDLEKVLKETDGSVTLLLDCVTLWLNNHLYESDQRGEHFTEEEGESLVERVLDLCRGREAPILFVTNELGMGIIPGDPLTRLYRDIVGRVNQAIARRASEVVFMVSGVAMKVKG